MRGRGRGQRAMSRRVRVVASSRRRRRQVIEQALGFGHEVTALDNQPRWFKLRRERHRVVKGNVLQEESLGPAMAKQDAVVCWLSQRGSRKPTTFFGRARPTWSA